LEATVIVGNWMPVSEEVVEAEVAEADDEELALEDEVDEMDELSSEATLVDETLVSEVETTSELEMSTLNVSDVAFESSELESDNESHPTTSKATMGNNHLYRFKRCLLRLPRHFNKCAMARKEKKDVFILLR